MYMYFALNEDLILKYWCFTCMAIISAVKANIHFESLVASLVDSLSITMSCNVHMFPCDELHMSVSRTVPIRNYWIEPITEQLSNGFSSLKR